MVIDGAADERRCVACGFVEARPDAGASMPPTRVTRASARRVETEAEAVRLLDEEPSPRPSHNLNLCEELIKNIGIHNAAR